MLFGDEQKDAVIPYSGTVTIDLKIIEKTDLIVIHSTNLTINGVGFDLVSATQTVIKHLVIEAHFITCLEPSCHICTFKSIAHICCGQLKIGPGVECLYACKMS